MAGEYLPSIKGGGPIQSIKNMVDNLSNHFNFYVVAWDRDFGDSEAFKNISTDEWLIVGNAKVLYTNKKKLTWKKLIAIINSIDFDTMYLNSFFSYNLSIKPIVLNKFRIIKPSAIILAPRGQFSEGALNLKPVKKKLFMMICKLIGVHRNIIWHATAELEKNNIINNINSPNKIIVANNLTANYSNIEYKKELYKKSNEIMIVFVSRIHPKKNLLKCIEILSNLEGSIQFDIYGPIEDQQYWKMCCEKIKQMSENIKVNYYGPVSQDAMLGIYYSYHILFFPTLGENYGHVISEALIGGCPVIISDQTPWRDLQSSGVGWDINLDDDEKFISAIKSYVMMDNEKYQVESREAYMYSKRKSNLNKDLSNTISMLENN